MPKHIKAICKLKHNAPELADIWIEATHALKGKFAGGQYEGCLDAFTDKDVCLSFNGVGIIGENSVPWAVTSYLVPLEIANGITIHACLRNGGSIQIKAILWPKIKAAIAAYNEFYKES